MRLLLDTHTFLWWLDGSPRLSAAAREAVADDANAVYVSAVTGWEIAIKASLGRLTLPGDPATAVLSQMDLNGMRDLPVRMEHALRVATLPHRHADPFDRLLVAQSMIEGLTIVTADSHLLAYNVPTLW